MLPPKVVVDDGVDATELKELCFQYRYDYRNRRFAKKVPGKDWEYTIYNKLDQPILKQDALLRVNDQWLFTKYDALGRTAYTGKITITAKTRPQLQTEVNDFTDKLWVTRGNAITIGGVTMYYNDGGYPKTTTGEVLTINYYDDYGFLANEDVIFNNPTTVYGESITTRTKSLSTGSKVKVLDTDKWITAVTYYDKKARPIYTASKNQYLNTTDSIESKLDFVGKVLETKTTHIKDGNPLIATIDKFEYDHMGRATKQTQKINTQPEEVISENTYDALGQLESKKVGGGLQDVKYDYNVRGWLKAINKGTTANGALFGYKINYNDPERGATALYNGNIAEIEWQTANDNVQRWYKYSYDPLSRIKSGISSDGKYNLSSISYDKVGNIQSLRRSGFQNSAVFTDMDILSYEYKGTNKLLKVTDTGNKTFGFKDGTNTNDDFEYDINGNMTIDRNKGITDITYNHLNLPKTVNVANTSHTGNISYIYSATGTKLKKIVITEGSSLTTEYARNYVYKNNSLEFFNQPEGIVEKEANGYKYVYQFKDHLNNVRLSYSDKNEDDAITQDEIVQENNYYPFGLKHKGYNTTLRGRNHNYDYLGQERQEELGLNWHSYKWRNADSALGRFFGSDPITEDYYYQTNYQFASNNPVWKIEVEGLEGQKTNNGTDINDGGVTPPSDLDVAFAVVDQNDLGANMLERGIAKATFLVLSVFNYIGSGGQESFGQINPKSVDTGFKAVRAEVVAQTTLRVGSKVSLPKSSKKPPSKTTPNVSKQVVNEAKRVNPNVNTATLQPGPNANKSIPARSKSQTFNTAERNTINEMGTTDGCHTCGSTKSGRASGNFTPDHQPPSSLVQDGTPQNLYPQCQGCSSSQGGTVGSLKKKGFKTENIKKQ